MFCSTNFDKPKVNFHTFYAQNTLHNNGLHFYILQKDESDLYIYLLLSEIIPIRATSLKTVPRYTSTTYILTCHYNNHSEVRYLEYVSQNLGKYLYSLFYVEHSPPSSITKKYKCQFRLHISSVFRR